MFCHVVLEVAEHNHQIHSNINIVQQNTIIMALTKHLPSGLHVREATREDKAEIVQGFNIYDGWDYLEHRYDHFLDHPNIFPYVAQLHGKIVSRKDHTMLLVLYHTVHM